MGEPSYQKNKRILIDEQKLTIGHTKCEYCGREPLQPYNDKRRDFLTIDHITPKSKGGSDEISNLRVCCLDCNKRKGSDV